MKYNFCTIIDHKFIPHFLIQYNSFQQIVKNEYVFWVLCVDYESYTFLQKYHLKNVQVLYWKDIEDTKLHEQRIKHNHRI